MLTLGNKKRPKSTLLIALQHDKPSTLYKSCFTAKYTQINSLGFNYNLLTRGVGVNQFSFFINRDLSCNQKTFLS